MNYLYSPWRLNYILSKKEKECIFCTKPNQDDDEKNLIVYRTKHIRLEQNTALLLLICFRITTGILWLYLKSM